MRIAHTVAHAIQEGASNATLATRGGVTQYETITEHTEVYMLLAATSGDVAVPLGGVSIVKTLYLEADQNVTVKLGGVDKDAIDLKANFPLALVMATGVATVHINNATATQATVKGVIGG